MRSRSSDRLISAHASSRLRSPVLVARKYAVAVLLQPRAEAVLGLPVAGRDVDVVDAEAVDQLHGLVGLVLGDVADRGGAEQDAGALVAGASEAE